SDNDLRMAPIPWVITREADDAKPIVDALIERGIDARCVPCIERTELPWPTSFVDACVFSQERLWFVTSPYCARLVLARLRPQRPEHVAAIAPSTTAAFGEEGYDVVDVQSGGGAVELAKAVVAAGINAAVLYPTSDAGLSSPEQRE